MMYAMFDEPTSQPAGRVHRRQQRARIRLTQAAASLIAQNGVEGLRLRDVADLADIGFGSFYKLFSSKEELINAVRMELMSSLAHTLVAHVETLDDPAEAASAAHRWFVRNATTDPQTARLVVNLDSADVLFQEMIQPYARRLINSGIAAGRFKDMDASATLIYVVGATVAVTRSVLDGRLGPEAESATAEILLAALGLNPTEAKEIANLALPPISSSACPTPR